MENVKILWQRCRETAQLPRYARMGDAGMDVMAAEEIVLGPGETKLVPLGFKVAIPVGFELQVRARSGLSLKTRLRLANGVGTIDSGFRGELAVLMANTSQPGDPQWTDEVLDCGEKSNRAGVYHIHVGDRIAQLVPARVPLIQWEENGDVEAVGENRGGGFGHSGINDQLEEGRPC